MNDQEKKIRGERVRQILEDDTFKDALRAVEKESIEKMIATKDDAERRQERDFVLAVRSVVARLAAWRIEGRMVDGKISGA